MLTRLLLLEMFSDQDQYFVWPQMEESLEYKHLSSKLASLHSVTMFVIGSPLGLPLKQVSSGMLPYVTFLLPHLIAHPPTMYFIAFLLTLISLPRPLDGSKSSLSNYPQKKSLDCFLLCARDSCNEREGLHQSSHAVKHSLKIAITVRTNTRADSHAAKIIQREAE